MPDQYLFTQKFIGVLFVAIIFRKRFLDANDLKESMEGKLFLRPSLIRPTMSIAEDRDWVTIAVVARCNDPQSAKNVGCCESYWLVKIGISLFSN